MLGTQNHEGNSENCVGSCGEHFQALAVFGLKFKACTAAFANPISLNFFNGICPIQAVKPFQQTLCVCCYSEAPLSHLLSLYRIAASNAHSVHHFIICQHRTEFTAPINHRIGQISQSVVHKHVALLFFVKRVPLLGGKCRAIGMCGIYSFLSPIALLGEDLHKLRNRACRLAIVTIIAVKQFEKYPLRPLIVVFVAGSHLSVPIVRQTQNVKLLSVSIDVLFGCNGRVLSCLDCVLFCRQSVRIVTHRVKYIEALQTFVSRKDV